MPTPAKKKSAGTPSVDAYLATLDHPRLPDILALRALIRDLDPAIGEEIKWNAPSFFTTEHFATMRLVGKPPLQLILHLGAKKQTMPGGAIDDPSKLLTWLGPDRACINFDEEGAVTAHRDALQAVVRQWLTHVPKPVR